jgi:3-oxoacyl-[acyl-carrier protein] reductase
MDLGIAGRTAVVCASSRGLGKACAQALAREGVNVVVNGRDPERLKATAAEIKGESTAGVTAVEADVTTAEGRAKLLAACPQPDILINNNAGPPPKNFLDVEPEDWAAALDANMIAALALTRAVVPAMKERHFGRIINITSAMVSTPRGHMGLSSGARAGLTAVMKGQAIDLARFNITINNMLPERIDTDRQHFMAEREMKAHGITYEEARARQVASIPAGRLGRPSEFGATCAFLCSDFAGFITGMNVHLDGGAYPALL